MSTAPHVKTIFDICGSDMHGTKASQGGPGKQVMLSVEPVVEQDPARSFAPNPAGDPIMDRNTIGRPAEDALPDTVTHLFRQATR